ncbi:microtubule-associated protein 70-2 [Tanacetum coccineum]
MQQKKLQKYVGRSLSRNLLQIAKLQDDNTALDRFTKSKEAALLEAQRTIQVVSTKASMVNDLQNKNQELVKQIKIFLKVMCNRSMSALKLLVDYQKF